MGILKWFYSLKNLLVAIGSAILGGYALYEKFKALNAETKLNQIKKQLSDENLQIIKDVAEHKIIGKEIENNEVVKQVIQMHEEKQKIEKEVEELNKKLEETKKETPVTKVVDKVKKLKRKKVQIEI